LVETWLSRPSERPFEADTPAAGRTKPAIAVRQPDPAAQFTSQNNQLMSKYHILRLKTAFRLERQDQNGQYEMQKPEHPASYAIPSLHQLR
jgi:hypothetical protein